MNETTFRNQLQIDLAKHGIKLFRNVVSLLYTRTGQPITVGTPGQADLIGWVPYQGRAVYLSIETKAEKGTIRPEQRAWQEAVRKDGGIALIVRPSDNVLKLITESLCPENLISKPLTSDSSPESTA